MNITLDQLTVFSQIAATGGVNAAAEAIHRSPSAVSHALHKLQQELAVELFEKVGRRLEITEHGRSLLPLAEQLLNDRQHLIDSAALLNTGFSNELSIAIDAVLPHPVILDALARFSDLFPACKVRLSEEVLTGVEERVRQKEAEIGIGYRVPPGMLGERLMDITFLPVAAPGHVLAGMNQISSRELIRHRQIVVADSGMAQQVDSGWLKAQQRWTVSSMYTSLNIIRSGAAFAWLPAHLIEQPVEEGELVVLNLSFASRKTVSLYSILLHDENEIAMKLARYFLESCQAYTASRSSDKDQD